MRSIKDILEGTSYSDRQLELFLSTCYADFIYFAEHCLGFDIAPYHEEWFELVEKYKRLCIEAYRGSGKTNFFAAYYLWKAIFTDKPLNFLIVSNNFEQSKMVLKIIRNMILENELLKEFAPDSRDMSWKATELTIKTGCNFYCKPYGEGIRGLRIDYCMCDEGGLYEDKAIFWTVIGPVVQLNMGRITVVGTPRSRIDLLAELHENEEYFAKKYPAEHNGHPLWAKKYTMKEEDEPGKRSLKLVRKELGELNYMQEYMLIPISSANSIFPLEMIMPCVSNIETFQQYGEGKAKYFVGADMAISKDGDYTVFSVISVKDEGKRLVFAKRFRGEYKEQKDKLQDIYNRFRPSKILMDKTGLGEQIFRELSVEIPNIEPLHFTYDEKFKLIMDLRHEFETGNMLLPSNKADIACYDFTQELIKELNDFVLKVDLQNRTKTKTKFGSGAYDDCVISLSLANRASQNPFGSASIRSI